MTHRRLHMIGNAHIDPVWLWTWPEGMAEVRATFRSALDRMREYPDFRFSQGSAAYYAWVEEHDPAMFQEIRERVAEGRWELVGGWWVEPDCNVPSGESFVRQALLGQRFFASRFGRTATVGLNADPFGHAATLPAILAGAGLRAYAFLRPGPHELALPEVFWWAAPDGSRVLAMRIPHEYCAPGGDVGGHVDKVVAHLTPDVREALCFYGVGNHGGGPTRANLDSIARLNATDLAPELVLSTLGDFATVAAARPDLPVVRAELLHHAVGCYSAHTGIKRWVRRSERLLGAAEALGAVGTLLGGPAYPRRDLERAWANLLFNEFHDILAGTAIEAAYDDARDQLGETASIAGRAIHAGVTAIASRIDIPLADDLPAVVVNPHPFPVTGVVELEGFRLQPGFALHDETGTAVPVQPTRASASVGAGRARVAFGATLPPLGYRLYRLARTGGDGVPWEMAPALPPVVEGAPVVLANATLRVEVDPATGGVSLFRPGAAVPLVRGRRYVVYEDGTDTWSHRALAYRNEAGAFEATGVHWIEDGPVRSIVRVEHRFGASTLTEDLVVAADVPYLEVRATLDWHERRRLVKLRVDVAVDDPAATHEIPFGRIERPVDGTEFPTAGFVDVSGTTWDGRTGGVTLLSVDRPGADVRGSEIGLTVVRSPGYAHHDPAPAPDDARAAFLDQGAVPLHVALLPHEGRPVPGEAERAGAALALPPVALWETFHAGPLPATGSFLEVAPATVLVTAAKLGEDDDVPVVRVRETAGLATIATLRVGRESAPVQVELAPFELATFRLPAAAAPVRVDLLERELPAEASATDQPGTAASANDARSGNVAEGAA